MLDQRASGTPVIARLRPGVTLAAAKAALDAVTPASTIMGPTSVPARVMIRSMYEDETAQFGATIGTLSVAVALILIIACVNVAGLLLARGATRDVELAIRASIGAGRARLVRQLLTESLLLAVAGALIGVLLAYVSLDSLVALIPLSLPPNSPVAINGTVLAFALGLTCLTALLFGLVPALKLSRAPKMISTMLSVGGRSGAPLSKRAGEWLIAGEVALALVLMTGSGLIAESRSFSATQHYQPLFDIIATPAGFSAQLVTSDSGYMFKVRDTVDQCGIVLFSDQDGLIYTARPLQ
ncbi:MAG TPA: FtsX-like permease family protein [Vicinamibacterales bacterium]|nr:FtsX-like permease family protein [Vicinamibacterales bacterium]